MGARARRVNSGGSGAVVVIAVLAAVGGFLLGRITSGVEEELPPTLSSFKVVVYRSSEWGH